jgi:carbon-monoxide dehydrogenase catalytic subunit
MTSNQSKSLRASFPSRQDVRDKTPDPAVRALLDHCAEKGISTVFDRFDRQKSHCKHGLNGVCCHICHMGPCQITARAPRGACGADADVVVARNILRWLAGGVASHGARGREAVLALKAAAEGTFPQPIRGIDKVKTVAKALGLFREDASVEEMAGAVADALLEDLGRSTPGELRSLRALAPAERVTTWEDLDILPIGAYQEVFEALHRTSVGTDADWRNLMRQFLRCGLAFSWSSVAGSAIATECLYGPPTRSRIETNVGALDADSVNIAIHGHSPVLATAIIEAGDDPELVARARDAGASGIKFYGVCCSGLNTLYRNGGVHPLANAVGAELVLATGAVDLWVADLQDIYPGIMDVANCFHTKVVTTNDSARLPGAIFIGFDHRHSNLQEVRTMARQIVSLAIDNMPFRKAANVLIPQARAEAEIGFSIENLGEALGGHAVLAELLQNGVVQGVVNVVGCNNPKVPYEVGVTAVVDVLLRNDILVLTNGCASFPLLKQGYCTADALAKAGPGLRSALGSRNLPPVLHMGECLDNARASGLFRVLADLCGQPMKTMPFAFSSPEWSNEKGVGAALAFRLLGLDSYHCIAAPVSGSPNVQRFLEDECRETLGGGMVVIQDPAALGERIVGDLLARRKRLGWPAGSVKAALA